MLNFVPKRCPSVSLLFGKRPIQRIEVGPSRHQMEVPLSVINRVYDKIDTTVEYHNNDYNPMKWRDYMDLKLNAYFLMEASQAPSAAKSALPDLNWFSDLADIYAGHQTMVQMDIASKSAPRSKLTYPIQGKNIIG